MTRGIFEQIEFLVDVLTLAKSIDDVTFHAYNVRSCYFRAIFERPQ